jgi:hypothetical protein
MAEGSQETDDQRVQVSRASTAPALPAIITTTASSRKEGHHNNDNSNKNDSPTVATPGLLKTSQSFPVGMCNSYRLPFFKDWPFQQISPVRSSSRNSVTMIL